MKSYSPQSKRLLACLVYFVGVLCLADPPQLSTTLLGNNIDSWIFHWNDWWLREALTTGQSPFSTTSIFAPTGTSLLAHSHSFVNSLLALPLTSIVNSVAAYNIVLLFGLWVGAVGTYTLVHKTADSSIGAFLAGVTFTLMPYHLTQALAHGNLGGIHWWPWAIWALIRLLETRERRFLWLTAGLAALNFWSGLHIFILFVMWGVTYCVWLAIQEKWLANWKQAIPTLTQLAQLGALTFALCLPYILPLIRNYASLQNASAAFSRATTAQTDLLAYITPPYYNPFFGELVGPLYARFEVNRGFLPYLGLASLMLIAAALRYQAHIPKKRYHPHVRFWATVIVGTIILALGSQLRFAGTVYNIPLPYSLVESVVPFSTLRSPDRINLLLVPAVAQLVGFGAAELWRRQRYWLVGAALVITLLEFAVWPLPRWALPPSSAFFTQLASRPNKDEVVLDFPTGYSFGKRWLYYQTLHGRPTIDGHISRFDNDTYTTIRNTPALQAFYWLAEPPNGVTLQRSETMPISVANSEAIASLQQLNVRYIVHHHTFSSEDEKALFTQLMPYLPVYEDGAVTVYDLQNLVPITINPARFETSAEVRFANAFVLSSFAWEQQVGELQLSLNYIVEQKLITNNKLFVHLRDSSGTIVRQYDAVPCQWQCPTSTWQVGAAIEDSATLNLVDLPAGLYTLAIGFYDEATGTRLSANGQDSVPLGPPIQLTVDNSGFDN